MLLFAAVVLAMALCTLVGAVQRRLAINRPIALLLSLLACASHATWRAPWRAPL
jgi:predicted PurR-regulated permease PerM